MAAGGATPQVKSTVKRDASVDPQFYTSSDATPNTYIVTLTDAAAAAAAARVNTSATTTPPSTAAKVDQAIVVGASDRNDARSVFGGSGISNTASNYGSFVTVFAPGTGDRAANFPGSSLAPSAASPYYTSFAGTSAATPIVAGIAAQYLQTHPNARHEEVKAWIINNATVGTLTNLPAGSNTPNKLVFTNL